MLAFLASMVSMLSFRVVPESSPSLRTMQWAALVGSSCSSVVEEAGSAPAATAAAGSGAALAVFLPSGAALAGAALAGAVAGACGADTIL